MRDGTAFCDTQSNVFIFGSTETVGIRKPSLLSRSTYVDFIKNKLTLYNFDSKKTLFSTSYITAKEIHSVMIFRLSVMLFFIIKQAADHYACTFFLLSYSSLALANCQMTLRMRKISPSLSYEEQVVKT
ncbi:hypothetical protein [Erwinia piriflorinigrans]|uniref:hypothetical protein n=1 Tax=Erwinia piriflorinigrans TaxID=665097 RepID=UPI00066003C6|nr:hypothetical protein [Erwinia piriflorinigrans]